MYQAFTDYIIIKTNRLFNEETKFSGIDGQKILLSVKFDPARHVNISGEVVSVPKMLSRMKLHQNPVGLPSYNSQVSYQWKWLDDIAMEIEVGDKIYFHYNVIMDAIRENNYISVEGRHPNRTWYIKVRYDRVFCTVRAGKIIPIQGYSFIRPNFESWEDILKPVPVIVNGKPMTNKDGSQMFKPKDQWIAVKSAPTHKFLEGFVEHIGTPLRGEKRECEVGQKILYTRNADWLQECEGHNYFTVLQRHLIGRFEAEAA